MYNFYVIEVTYISFLIWKKWRIIPTSYATHKKLWVSDRSIKMSEHLLNLYTIIIILITTNI